MKKKAERYQEAAERTVKDIRSQTRKRYSAEEKIPSETSAQVSSRFRPRRYL